MDLIDIDKSYNKLLKNINTQITNYKTVENPLEKDIIKKDIDRDMFYMKFLSIQAKGFDKEVSEDIYKNYTSFKQTLYGDTKETSYKSIEKDIKMINGLFNDIHTLVNEQSEKLNIIEDNIVITENKIEKAEEELESIGTSIKTKVLTFLFVTLATVTGITFIR